MGRPGASCPHPIISTFSLQRNLMPACRIWPNFMRRLLVIGCTEARRCRDFSDAVAMHTMIDAINKLHLQKQRWFLRSNHDPRNSR